MTDINIGTERDKQFHDLIKQVAGKLAKKCKYCSGDGYLFGGNQKTKPCPKCAKLRAMGDECWHERKVNVVGWLLECSCGIHYPRYCTAINPTYTIQTIVAALKDLGLWESFAFDFILQMSGTKVKYLNDIITVKTVIHIMDAMSDKSNSLLIDAAISFLREVLDNG
jgi:hypothetical protein